MLHAILPKKLKLVLKICLGILFICSSILKLIDIDKFELYVYSYNFLTLGASYVLARLLIAFEFLLGVALVVNLYNRYVLPLAMLTLVGFTLFLGYAVVLGRTDNCHCFGDYVKFNPTQSIIKNIIFMVVVLLCKGTPNFNFRLKWYVLTLCAIVPFVGVFILSPPDNMVDYSVPIKNNVNEELLRDYIQPNGVLDTLEIGNGRKMVGFYSPNCKYCKLSARKINTVQQRGDIPTENIITVFGGEKKSLDEFYKETETTPLQPIFLDVDLFLPLTLGRFPVVLLLEDGKVEYAFQYRSIDEDVIKDFFSASNN